MPKSNLAVHKTQKLFPVIDSVKFAWQKIKGFKAIFWVAFLIYILINIAIGLVTGFSEGLYAGLTNVPLESAKFLTIPYQIISWLFISLANAGIFYLVIRYLAKLPVKSRMMFTTFKFIHALKILGTLFLLGIIFWIPLSLFFVPMLLPKLMLIDSVEKILTALSYLVGSIAFIYLLIRLSMSFITVVDRQVNPWQAIKLSWIGTRGNFWRILGFFIINFLILIAGLIPIGIGLIWTLPYSFLAQGVLYRDRLGIVTKT